MNLPYKLLQFKYVAIDVSQDPSKLTERGWADWDCFRQKQRRPQSVRHNSHPRQGTGVPDFEASDAERFYIAT